MPKKVTNAKAKARAMKRGGRMTTYVTPSGQKKTKSPKKC